MRKGYKITLGVLTIMILITLTIGTSYSYYSVGGVQDKDNVLATRCFSVDYEDGFANYSSISLNNAYPMSPSKGIGTTNKVYKFKISNTCSASDGDKVNYKLILSRVVAQNFDTTNSEETLNNLTKNLRYTLTVSSTPTTSDIKDLPTYRYRAYTDSEGTAHKGWGGAYDFLNYQNEDKIGEVLGRQDASTEKVDPGNSFMLVNPFASADIAANGANASTNDSFTWTLNPGQSQEFYLRLWIDENACDGQVDANGVNNCDKIMGTSFKGRLLLYAYV